MFPIFEKLGGEAAAIATIAAKGGKSPNGEVLRWWRRSKRIPPARAIILLDECRRRGISASYDEDCRLRDNGGAE